MPKAPTMKDWEGSAKDKAEDKAEAKRGVKEGSAADKKADKAGLAGMKRRQGRDKGGRD